MTDPPPYWHPACESDIQKVVDDGLLDETHYLDCKREITSKGDSKETARDLASFAIDGGMLLVGVAEDKEIRRFTLSPQSLSGLAEKVENIAATIIDPPLHVIPQEIKSAADNSKGFLLVEVRPSPHAPHMVDGVYYGRGEKTRIRLTDAEVRRFHAQRQSIEEQIHKLLDEEIQRDPVPPEQQVTGHLYLVAQPLTASRAMARTLVRQQDTSVIRDIVRTVESRLPRLFVDVPPSASEATRVQRRAHGVALCSSSAAGTGRTFCEEGYHPEERLLDIEFREDGSIRMVMGRATFAVPRHDHEIMMIADNLMLAYVARLLGWTDELARKVNYRGQWALVFTSPDYEDS